MMIRKLIICLIALFAINATATETKLIVRAKAKDAKFIGSSLGGAHVMVKNQLTGEILAQGKTMGSTGNTELIMSTPHERGMYLSDENTAKFETSIDIEEPVFIRIEVFAPINKKQAKVNAATELWLIPGKHILGDGIIIEIPGFIVDVLQPRTHQYISLTSIKDKLLKVQANVVMMCGCTINKNGIWDSEKMEVKAIVKLNDKILKEVSLNFVSTNLFETEVLIEEKGEYEIIVYAFQNSSGNTGVDKVNYIIH